MAVQFTPAQQLWPLVFPSSALPTQDIPHKCCLHTCDLPMWHLSLSIAFSRVTHVAVTSAPFLVLNASMALYRHTVKLSHSSTDGHLGCFLILLLTESIALLINVHMTTYESTCMCAHAYQCGYMHIRVCTHTRICLCTQIRV
jgi:hypothetical protein